MTMQVKGIFHSVFLSLALTAPLSLLPTPAIAGAWSAVSDWGGEAADKFRLIRDQGSTDLYLSGYDRHGRSTYTKERL